MFIYFDLIKTGNNTNNFVHTVEDLLIKPVENFFNLKKKGRIIIVHLDADTGWGIKNTEFSIINGNTGKTIEYIKTNKEGIATSRLLNYGHEYIVKEVSINNAYERNSNEYLLQIENAKEELTIESRIGQHIVNLNRKENGELEIGDVYIPVSPVIQNPELPNGCEITSLTSILNTYGYEISKTEMADNYLPQVPFSVVNDKLYGPNPYDAYAGDPRLIQGGFFVYAPPVVEAAKNYIHDVGGNHQPIDISGSTREEILAYLDQGIPVVVWMTLTLDEPRFNFSWYIHETEELFKAPVNLHASVLNGYFDDKVHVMDPLKGQVIYDADNYFDSYDALGRHALIVVEK